MRSKAVKGTSPIHIIDNPPIDLYAVDILDGLGRLPDESISVVVTSPPYNIGANYSGYQDNLESEKYLAWMGKIAVGLHRILDSEGSLFLNVGARPSDPIFPWDVADQFRQQSEFKLQNVIHWIKSIAIDKRDGSVEIVGHYKPITSNRFLHNCHEYIYHFTKTGSVEIDPLGIGVPYKDKSNVKRWKRKQRDKRSPGSAWFIPYETINGFSERPHPTTFPIELPKRCIKLHGEKNVDVVLDPFMGIGNTAVACQSLSKSCIGFDIDKEYLQTAYDRLVQHESSFLNLL